MGKRDRPASMSSDRGREETEVEDDVVNVGFLEGDDELGDD